MYVNKETDHDVWKFMMYVDDGSMMDVDTSCMKSMDLYMMYPHPSWIHRQHTSCNQIHQFRVYIIDRNTFVFFTEDFGHFFSLIPIVLKNSF